MDAWWTRAHEIVKAGLEKGVAGGLPVSCFTVQALLEAGDRSWRSAYHGIDKMLEEGKSRGFWDHVRLTAEEAAAEPAEKNLRANHRVLKNFKDIEVVALHPCHTRRLD